MSPVTGPRPGGRSARIQQAVHAAARTLLDERERVDITVPMLATRAGVTPSTIYRRWGDIGEVFADVSIERLRPDMPPRVTGDVRADLISWANDYFEEMSAPVGRESLRDVVISDTERAPDGTNQAKCVYFCRTQIEAIVEGADRGEREAEVAIDDIIDFVVAPIVYRILFDLGELSGERVEELVDTALAKARIVPKFGIEPDARQIALHWE